MHDVPLLVGQPRHRAELGREACQGGRDQGIERWAELTCQFVGKSRTRFIVPQHGR